MTQVVIAATVLHPDVRCKLGIPVLCRCCDTETESTCYVCGNYACPDHLSTLPYLGKDRPVCDVCQEDHGIHT